MHRRYPNVYLQIGGMMAAWGHSSPYVVNETAVIDRINAGIEAFGYHRVCFGVAQPNLDQMSSLTAAIMQ